MATQSSKPVIRLTALASRITPLLALLACSFAMVGCEPAAPTTAEAKTHQSVTIDGQTFNLELALDNDTQFKGLSDREHIAPDGGMLFVFAEVRRPQMQFVMRHCLVPIDIIFLGPNGRVLATHAMQTEPYDTPENQLKRYGSGYPGQFAIELAGGTLESLSIKRGDSIDLPLDELKALAR